MPKRKKNRKNLGKAKSVPANTSPASPKKPRLDPRERQLSRFYEPLVLLYTLGSTRGEHTAAALSPDENICELPLKELRRRFLSELAYVCDYDKGGDTATAIGLESTPQRYVFWVGANTNPQKRIVPFLETLLAKLRDISTAATSKAPEEADNIAIECIKFGTPRINKYRQHLNPLLRRCQGNLAKSLSEESRFKGPILQLRTISNFIKIADIRLFFSGRPGGVAEKTGGSPAGTNLPMPLCIRQPEIRVHASARNAECRAPLQV